MDADLAPLLKWPGGKRFLSKSLASVLTDNGFHRYYEPFAGGAAVFFAMRPTHATLNDANAELIHLYQIVRDRPADLKERLRARRFRNDEAHYYRVRRWTPTDSVDRAARLYFLMRLSFNGIYRENLSGEFNVPYGYKTHIKIIDDAAIDNASAALRHTTLTATDFRRAALHVQPGDAVYFDPPYTTAHNNNGFIKYNSQLFSIADQIDLAELAKLLDAKGVTVIVSNADFPDITALYARRLSRIVISRASVMAADRRYRGTTTEVLFVSKTIFSRVSEQLCS